MSIKEENSKTFFFFFFFFVTLFNKLDNETAGECRSTEEILKLFFFFFNEIHRIINEIHRSKPKPTSVASENVLAI